MPNTSAIRCLSLIAVALVAASTAAQETPLFERPPSDLIVLDKASKSAEVEVLPLPPGTGEGRLPTTGTLRARLLDNPAEEIEIAYASIDRIEVFPERLLSAAKEAASRNDFGTAYDHFARLERDHAGYPGLSDAFAAALRAEAVVRFRAGDFDHALALLQTLNERSAAVRGLAQAVDQIGEAIVKTRWEEGDYAGVRKAIDTISGQFSGLRLSLEKRWGDRMREGAARERRRAEQLAAAGRAREALRVIGGALALDPKSIETNRLLEKLSANDKTLWIGVWETAALDATPDLDRPAARRQSDLLGGRLVSLEAYRPSGGEYETAVGPLDVDASKRSLTIAFTPNDPPDAAYQLARALLDPAGSATTSLGLLRQRAASYEVDSNGSLRIDLLGPHPQPVALVTGALPAGVGGIASGQWRRVDLPRGTKASARYERVGGRGAFDVIEEYVYADADAAIDALRSREVHALIDVPAWKLPSLQATPGIALAERRLPTLHCLLMSPTTPIRQRREVRRALCYAIAREQTLSTVVLGGVERSGFETLSAPFPRGRTLSDPLRYAYNGSVEPRPYEPRLAALLLSAARAADVAEEDATKVRPPNSDVPTTITLAHPPTPVGRVTGGEIKKQLEAVGFGVALVEVSEADLASGGVEYDLRYAEITVSEPLVDVWRLLGPDGVSGWCSPPMREALERVLSAASGKNAASALQDLHRVVYADVPLIPLWQTVDRIAYQKNLDGVPKTTVGAYQTVDAWRIGGGGRR
ncbi:MAG: ABC transporter substrate-binding protein [Planctomycetota bacterium]